MTSPDKPVIIWQKIDFQGNYSFSKDYLSLHPKSKYDARQDQGFAR
jgi:hypothetical protein